MIACWASKHVIGSRPRHNKRSDAGLCVSKSFETPSRGSISGLASLFPPGARILLFFLCRRLREAHLTIAGIFEYLLASTINDLACKSPHSITFYPYTSHFAYWYQLHYPVLSTPLPCDLQSATIFSTLRVNISPFVEQHLHLFVMTSGWRR